MISRTKAEKSEYEAIVAIVAAVNSYFLAGRTEMIPGTDHIASKVIVDEKSAKKWWKVPAFVERYVEQIYKGLASYCPIGLLYETSEEVLINPPYPPILGDF